MELSNADDIYKRIKDQTGLTDAELTQKIEAIRAKYQGLLSDVGANIMIAKQLNVDLDLKSVSSILKISEITPSQNNVSVYARVKSIPPVKKYKAKDGGEGRIQAIYLFDDSGLIKLNLWQEKSSIVYDLGLDKNTLIFVKDAYVTQYNDRIELSLRHGGQIIKDPENAPSIIKHDENYIDVSDITAVPEKPIDTIGRIIAIYPARTFTNDQQKERKVVNFEISDGIRSIRCAAWDPWSSEIENDFSKGDIVKLCDVSVREGLNDLELYVNWSSTIVKNPKTKKKIPELKDIASADVVEAKISDINENQNCKLEGVIVSVNRNNLRFFKCPTCNERVHMINDEFICEKCNSVVNPVVNMFGSVDIDDATGILKIVFFGNLVEKIFGLKKEDVKKDISEDEKIGIFDKLEDSLLGKKVVVTGKTRLNSFSSQVEMICDSIDFS